MTDAEVKEMLAAKTPLAFWCKKRGMARDALADALRITVDDLI